MAGAGKKREKQTRRGDKKSPSSDGDKTASPGNQNSPPTALDGNRDPAASRERSGSGASTSSRPAAAEQPAVNPTSGPVIAVRDLRNLDLGAAASFASSRMSSRNLPKRPTKLNSTGRPINIKLNTFHVLGMPQKEVSQYDVIIGNGDEKRGLLKKVWASTQLDAALEGRKGWIYDGNKLAWSIDRLKSLQATVKVDLDQGQVKKENQRPNIHTVTVRYVKKVPFTVLQHYMDGKADYDDQILESFNFLDHLLRESPAQRLTSIKRNFYQRGEQRFELGGGLEALKGVYASIRLAHTGYGLPPTLSVNVDVANGTFYTSGWVHNAAAKAIDARDVASLTGSLRLGGNNQVPAKYTALVRYLMNVRVYTQHRAPGVKDEFIIKGLTKTTAKTEKFKTLDEKSGKEVETTIEQYFLKKYNKRLQYPDLPLLQTQKPKIRIPMELCMIEQNQRYQHRISDKQTANMIKFAVTLPAERWDSIQKGLKMLDWNNDKYLHEYGMRISPTPAQVQAKLLPPPKVQFSGAAAEPKTSGRWDLRGKRFLGPHDNPIKSWGVCIIPGRFEATKEQVEAFFQTFISVFQGHGGRFANKTPSICRASGNPGEAVAQIYQMTGNAVKVKPQILFFVVPDKDSETYNRIKKSADCRFGVVSQVLQAAHVQKNQAQYCSNVCMKVNAKLGGFTAQSVGLGGPKSWFTKPTMIIGADVTHGGAGSGQCSIAAITMSRDAAATRYIAQVGSNGMRQEMIMQKNWDKIFEPMSKIWNNAMNNGSGPAHLMYFRDGVAESQFAQVLEQEVKHIRRILQANDPKSNTKITAVCGSKRHHVRFFPDQQSGDKNGNPQPGSLVETGVTQPFENDFYLNAHSAIKGTARPVHYHVLLDEAGLKSEFLQNMIYEHSYQYVRSTTPVSLFPAIYYAHLAAARGIAHIDIPARQFREEELRKDRGYSQTQSSEDAEVLELLPMNNDLGIRGVMWYV